MKKFLLFMFAAFTFAACEQAPSTNEIWYTATAKVEPTFDDALTFGANVVSNVWDSETKRGVIAFDGDVTMIGEAAFNKCDKLTAITLPEGVTTIGEEAFYDCDGLTEFTIPDGVTSIGYQAFGWCTRLTSVTIPDSVTTIGYYAFEYCTSLTSVNIPDSVTSIGDYAFDSCTSLTEFKGKFADGDGRILVVDGWLIAFAQAGITEYTIPDSVTTIGARAFYNCDSLTSVTIPDSVTWIGYKAFLDCGSLTSVTIPDSVTTIGDYAFESCDSLTSITIPDSVTEIGSSAFNGCDSLTSITIPDSVTSIGYRAFQNCYSLTEFKGKFADGDGRILVVDGELIAFAQAGITEYTIPDSVTSIGDRAFNGCDSLTSITIPDSVTSIGDSAFYSCNSLTSVYCKATTPPTLDRRTSVFDDNGSGRKIYVPAASVEAYKDATNWSKYASVIVGYDFENGVVVE